MPGVQNVIGSHNHTIVPGSRAENCTEVNTESEQKFAGESSTVSAPQAGLR